MQKWEYLELFFYDNERVIINGEIVAEASKGLFGTGKKIPSKISVLNNLGEQGWELVAVRELYHYFKRPKK